MRKKLVSVLLSVAMTAGVLSGCGSAASTTASSSAATKAASAAASTAAASTAAASTAAASTAAASTAAASTAASTTEAAVGSVGADTTKLDYKGNLSIMHYSTSEESQGNGGSDGFRTVVAEWVKDHPDIKVDQQVLANKDYKTQIATYAAAGSLPDVFLLQGMDTKAWAKQGLIVDLTDAIKSSPYASSYNMSYMTPFTDNGKYYGFPVLTGGTCTVVTYDSAAWKAAGFDKFPTTWDDVEKASAYFKKKGVDTIAFGNGGQWQAESCFMSVLGDRYTGKDWFQSLIDKKGAKFTDATQVAALTELQRLFTKTGIFNKDFNTVTNEDAREYYISGAASAFIGGNWDVSYIGATLKSSNPTLYKNTKFAVLPQPKDAKGSTNSQDIGLGYAVAINSKVASDPAKLKAAIDFAEYVTGPEFSKYVGNKYALSGFTKSTNVDISKFDQYTQDFYNYSYVDTTPCEIYDSYISSAVWSVYNTEIQDMLNGNKTPAQVAKDTQDAYEKNY